MAAETLDVASMLNVQFEPKRQTQWVLRMEGIDSYLLKTAQRPTITTEEVEMSYINDTRYLAGKTKFNTIAVTLHDPIAPSGAQQAMEWIRTCYECVSGRGGYADFYKRDIQLLLLDPVGTVIELWDIKGAFITESNFGDLDYSTNADPVEISLTIRFDKGVLQF